MSETKGFFFLSFAKVHAHLYAKASERWGGSRQGRKPSTSTRGGIMGHATGGGSPSLLGVALHRDEARWMGSVRLADASEKESAAAEGYV